MPPHLYNIAMKNRIRPCLAYVINRHKKAHTAEVLPRRLPDFDDWDATDVSCISIDPFLPVVTEMRTG